MRDRQGNAWAHDELTASHDVDPPAAAQASPSPLRFSELVLAGTRVNGLLGTERYGYHIGADLSFGSTLRAGGFAYDLALFPLGGGLRLGATSAVMVGEFDAGRAGILTRARITYVAAAAARDRGSRTLSFADEAEAMLALRIGHHYESHGYPTGNGYFAGVAYRELSGARFLGLTIGYSLDVATR
jgi:hypothetical protein